MSEKNKKYLQKNDTDCLHIGNLIGWNIQQKHLVKAKIAKILNVLPAVIGQYIKQPSVQVAILWRLGIAIEYNLLADVAQRHPVAFETKKEKALQEALAAKEEELKNLKIEHEALKNFIKWSSKG